MALNIFNKSFGNNDISDATPNVNEDPAYESLLINSDHEAKKLTNEVLSEFNIFNSSVKTLNNLEEFKNQQELRLKEIEKNNNITSEEIGMECHKINLTISNIEGMLGASRGSLLSDLSFGNNSVSNLTLSDYRAGIEGIGDIIGKIKDKIVAFFKYIWKKIKELWNWLVGKKNKDQDEINKVLDNLKKSSESLDKILESKIKNDPVLKGKILSMYVSIIADSGSVSDMMNAVSQVDKIDGDFFEDYLGLIRQYPELKEKKKDVLFYTAISSFNDNTEDYILESYREQMKNEDKIGLLFFSLTQSIKERNNVLAGLFNKYRSKQSLKNFTVKDIKEYEYFSPLYNSSSNVDEAYNKSHAINNLEDVVLLRIDHKSSRDVEFRCITKTSDKRHMYNFFTVSLPYEDLIKYHISIDGALDLIGTPSNIDKNKDQATKSIKNIEKSTEMSLEEALKFSKIVGEEADKAYKEAILEIAKKSGMTAEEVIKSLKSANMTCEIKKEALDEFNKMFNEYLEKKKSKESNEE